MFVATATPAKGGDASSAWEWCEGGLQSYQPLSLDPSAQVLNYGQSIFEGLKAQRTSDGKIVLFRPDQNAARMTRGASRMAMAAPPLDTFMAGVTQVVRANASLVPPHGKGALYIRPLLLGTGAILGLGPAPEFTFLVYCAPVGAYFKSGQITPISLQVETSFHRAAPGGTGDTKVSKRISPPPPPTNERPYDPPPSDPTNASPSPSEVRGELLPRPHRPAPRQGSGLQRRALLGRRPQPIRRGGLELVRANARRCVRNQRHRLSPPSPPSPPSSPSCSSCSPIPLPLPLSRALSLPHAC